MDSRIEKLRKEYKKKIEEMLNNKELEHTESINKEIIQLQITALKEQFRKVKKGSYYYKALSIEINSLYDKVESLDKKLKNISIVHSLILEDIKNLDKQF